MECGISGCPRPETSRACVVCDDVSHHLCSNDALHSLNVEEEVDLCFCSISCYRLYADAENLTIRSESTFQHRRSYTYKFKREVLEDLKVMSTYAAQEKHGVPRRTIRNWDKDRNTIFSFEGSEKSRAARPGRMEIIPFAADLVTFMKDRRRQEKVYYCYLFFVN